MEALLGGAYWVGLVGMLSSGDDDARDTVSTLETPRFFFLTNFGGQLKLKHLPKPPKMVGLM